MCDRFISLYIGFLVSLSFVSTKNCEDYDFDKCGEYIYTESDDKTKKCFYDYELGKCQFKACSELSTDKCRLYKPDDKEYNCLHRRQTRHCELQKCTDLLYDQCYEFETNDEEIRCQNIENESGCELKKCSDYEITKCRDFYPKDSERSCVPFNGVCQEKKCSDYKSPNCGDFIPNYSGRKCISKGNECEEVFKECEDMPYDECKSYYPQSEEIRELEAKCVQKEDKSGCELKSCYFLKICAPNDDNSGCEIIQCSDIPKGNYNAFNDYFSSSNENKCIEPKEETEPNCQKVSKSCEEFDHKYCENFSTFDMGMDERNEFSFRYTRDFKRCIPKSDNTNCEIKRCSELSINDCNRFNTLNYLDHTEQCIAKKDNSGCEIKECEEMPTDECGLITNKNFFWKCEKENDKCVVKIKGCSEIPLLYCEISNEIGNNCHLDKSKTKCLSENDEDKDEENKENEENNPNKSNDEDKDEENKEKEKNNPNKSNDEEKDKEKEKNDPNTSNDEEKDKEKEENDPNISNEKKFIKLYLFSIILNLLNY